MESLKKGDFVAVKVNVQLFGSRLDDFHGELIEIDEAGGLVELDPRTLHNMTDELLIMLIQSTGEWRSLVIPLAQLKLSKKRSFSKTREQVVARRSKELGIVLKDRFHLDQFLKNETASAKEGKEVHKQLLKGMKSFFEIESDDPVKPISFYEPYLEANISTPVILGYAGLNILDSKRIIRPETKLAFAHEVVDKVNFIEEFGIPFAAARYVAYLISHGVEISILFFTQLMIRYTGAPVNWYEGVSLDELEVIVGWIIEQEAVSDAEKLWWVFHWTSNNHDAVHVVKKLSAFVFDHPALAVEIKRELCWAWLKRKQVVGQEPINLRLSRILINSTADNVEQMILSEFASDQTFSQAEFIKIGAQFKQAHLIGETAVSDELFDQSTLSEFSNTFVPFFLYRVGIAQLARMGEDLEQLFEFAWSDRGDHTDSSRFGVADVLDERKGLLDLDFARGWIEQGISAGLATTRRRFHMSAKNYFGDEYLAQALSDQSKMVRNWGEKASKS